MDQQTYNNLKQALIAAASPELAAVVLEQAQQQKDFETIYQCIGLLDTELLEKDNVQQLVKLIQEDGNINQAKSVLNPDVPAQKDILESLNALDLEQRPKLKVVEKIEVADTVDINRYREKSTTFNDVVGLDRIKKEINKKIILPFQKPSLFQRFKKKIGGGVLLFGPPGCGKTLLARATAGECKASFFNIEISDVLDMYIGETEQKLHAIFEKARAETPSVVFFDELEALGAKREHARSSTQSNMVSQFLTELDGFSQKNEGVLVLGSTNVPWAIDSAFLRPGRFDRMFFVPPPGREARLGILVHHMKERPAENDINYGAIASKTSGFSGADLANLVETATDEAIDLSIETGGDEKITFDHFKSALQECRPTTMEWLTTARNYARYANDGGRYNDVLDFLKKHGK
jgi:SpoVK/Ycf46/Vps4 family AAA+-type ATPase